MKTAYRQLRTYVRRRLGARKRKAPPRPTLNAETVLSGRVNEKSFEP